MKEYTETASATSAAAVKHARAHQGLSQAELGRRLGRSQTFVSRIELCDVPFTDDLIEQLARALDVPPSALTSTAIVDAVNAALGR